MTLADKSHKYWQTQIDREKRAHKTYRDEAEKSEKAARDDDSKKQAFNIWWSSCLVTHAAIYGARPKPDVRRRFQKPDAEEKELARLVERALEYQIDTGDFDAPSNMAVADFVRTGLGTFRVVYDAETAPIPDAPPGEDGNVPEMLAAQSVYLEHVPWKYFHWEPGKAWESVDWIAIESFRPRKELEAEYGVEIKAGKDTESKRTGEEYADEVQLYEIYYKPGRQVYVFAPTHPDLLEVRDDALNLMGFWPVPRPMLGNLKSDEMIPKPDYCFIEGQVKELNRVTQRIEDITAQVKAVGYYDASMKELARLVESKDGTLIAVNGLQQAAEGNPAAAVVYLPMIEKINTLRELHMQRDQIKAVIYETTGLSDIVRGASEAQETATAQQIKSQYANVRLSHKTKEVARVFRDAMRMMAEIICEHFSPQILQLQTGVQLTPRMVEMMRSDIGRNFAIDIETDSTIAQDDFEDRQQTMEMIDSILTRLEQVVPAVVQGALPVEFVQEALLLMVSKHKHGKQLEDAIMSLGPHWQGMAQFQQQLQQMQQQLEQQGMQLQQAGQEVQGLQQQLGQVNQREEARKDAEAQAKIQREMVEAEAQSIENRIVAQKAGIDMAGETADVKKTVAETEKIYHDMRQPNVRPMRPSNG